MRICIVTDAWTPQVNGVVKTLEQLARQGKVDRTVVRQALEKYRLFDVNAGTTGSTGGES